MLWLARRGEEKTAEKVASFRMNLWKILFVVDVFVSLPLISIILF